MISENGLQIIKTFEGLSSKRPDKNVLITQKDIQKNPNILVFPYLDIVGVKTIGWGSTNEIRENPHIFDNGIAVAQCEELLRHNCIMFSNAVVRYSAPFILNQNQLDALTSFAYNCGLNIKQTVKLIVACYRNNDMNGVKYHFLRWVYCGKVKNKVLTMRRELEYKLFMKI